MFVSVSMIVKVNSCDEPKIGRIYYIEFVHLLAHCTKSYIYPKKSGFWPEPHNLLGAFAFVYYAGAFFLVLSSVCNIACRNV